MIWDAWHGRFQAALDACARLDGDCRELVVAPPATAAQVEAVEHQLGLRLPDSFRQVLLGFSARVSVMWFLPEELETPDLFREVFSGDCRWDLDRLVDLEENRSSWVKACFPNADDPYDRVWHNKLAFQHVPTGDLLALDLAVEGAPVVYLSHEGGDFHGTILGRDFADFIDRWSLLGFVGSEDCQMEPFVTSPTGGLEPRGDNARRWREWFGLTV